MKQLKTWGRAFVFGFLFIGGAIAGLGGPASAIAQSTTDGGSVNANDLCSSNCSPSQAATVAMVSQLRASARGQPVGSAEARMKCSEAVAIAEARHLPGLTAHVREIWNCRD
jgi:hypothetical protein